MSYLIFNENWQTFKDQLKDVFSGQDYYNKKLKYFEKLFDMKRINKALVKIIEKAVPDPIKFTEKDLQRFYLKYKKTTHKGGSTKYKHKGKDIDVTSTYENDDYETYSSYRKDFHRSASINAMTQVTTAYKIPCGGGKFYLAYFTFDTDGISDMKVVAKDEDNVFGYSGYCLQDVSYIETIPPEMYRR